VSGITNRHHRLPDLQTASLRPAQSAAGGLDLPIG
jgi:hypothetical protein